MVVADASGNLSSQMIMAAGETNTASNLGSSSFGLYKQKSGSDLQFKSLTAATDGGIELVSNANDVQLKNNAYAAYGKVEVFTGDGTPNVIIKIITPTNNSAGSLEVDMAAISTNFDAVTGKKYVRYKKTGGVITLGTITDLSGTVADSNISTATWTITAASGNLEIKVTGVAATTIKWKPVYKLNEVY